MNVKEIHVREINESDFEHLSEFLSENALPEYNKNDYKRRFNFWWKKNPAFSKDDIKGWVIEDRTDRNYIKGFLGNIPTFYRINNKIYNAASPSTWVVLESYRKYSLNLLFPFLKQKKDFLVNSTPAKITEEIFLKIGFRDLAKHQNNYVYICSNKPIKHFLQKKFKYTYASKILSKLIYFIYNFFFNSKKNNKKKYVSIKKIKDNKEINQYLNKKNLALINYYWTLEKDRNTFFYGIENENDNKFYIYGQFVKSPTNKMKFLQILDTNIASGKFLMDILNKIKNDMDISLDFIILHNCKRNSLFFYKFIRFNLLSSSKCLIKSENTDINNLCPDGTLGEKGFIIWD